MCIFFLVSVEAVIVLILHVPRTLDLIMNGALAGGAFSGKVVLYVTKQINTIIAVIINVMILFIMIPFEIKHELLHPKGILIFTSLRML